MALLKSYTCTKCGGVLNFDEDQEIFECPFCGQEFNYTDFHRDELLNQASKCLKEFRYDTAKEKYDTLLSNNPQDFEAMRGMVLAQGRISSLEELDSPENLRNCDFVSAIKATDDSGKGVGVSAENRYFERLAKLLRLGEEFCEKTADALDKSEKAREKYRAAAEREKNSYNNLKLVGGILGFAFLAGLSFVFVIIREAIENLITWLVPATLFGYGLIAVIVLTVFIIYSYRVKHVLKVANPSEYLMEGHIIQDFLSEEAVEIKRHYAEELELLKKDDPAAKDYVPPKVKKKASVNDPFIDITKTVSCAKCGGQLHPDKDKGLFECKFCGVAYGMSLFFNNTLNKANEAINREDYIEADQRFSHMLMVNPKDFDALLGRIFCVGKWKTVYDIQLSETMLPAVCKNLKDRSAEGVEHAADEDRLFFLTMRDLAEVLETNARNEQTLKRCQNDLRAAAKKTEIHLTGNATSKELNGRKTEINAQIDKCTMTKGELLARFESLKESLLCEMNNHAARVSAS